MIADKSGSYRSQSIDVIKMLAAVLVVFQHSVGDGLITGYLLACSRVAVPLFMMVTGYLYQGVVERNRQNAQIKKYFKIAINMTILFFVLDLGWSVLKGNTSNYLRIITNPRDLIAFVFLNDPTVADHSWYLWAMIYTFIIVKHLPWIYKNRKIRLSIIVITILISLIFGKYSLLIFSKDIPSRFTRNVWTVGLPYFLIGYELSNGHSLLMKCRKKNLVIITLLTSALLVWERSLLVKGEVNASRDNYVFLTLLAIEIFVFILRKKETLTDYHIAEFGRRYSLIMYIIHPLFVRVEFALLDMHSGWQYIGFCMVLLISCISAVVLQKTDIRISSLLKSKIQNDEEK